ncbi:osmotically-inducible protein OsmY [Streptomyces sp. SAI-126]|uniref:BON domain-containing protein n=1 Tax=Streptomyces sp. SAI-126 TaxID=3377732 RepID=UPI003C7AAA3D
MNVHEGVVTLRGHIRDTSLISVAVRLVGAVEGVVDVEPQLGKGTCVGAGHDVVGHGA